jgi:uncharacterized protein YciI
MFVVISTYRTSIDGVLPFEQAHIAWVTEGYASGRILVSGPRAPLNGGVLVVRGTDVGEVADWMAADPFVDAGVVGFEVYEFGETSFPNRSAGFDAFIGEARM